MPRHIDAWMDGVMLGSVGPILIKEVHEDAPEMEIQTGERPGRYGQRLLVRKRQSLRVTLECQIRELRDLSVRTEYAEKLAGWCQGSLLKLSNHPGRRLRVYCSAEPTLGEARDYTSALRCEFTANEVPYWEDDTPTEVTVSGATGSGSLTVPGTIQTPICVTVTNEDGEPAESFSLTAGGQTITLTGIGLASGSALYLERDACDNLYIRRGSTGMMDKRSPESADDLMVRPGSVAYSYTADKNMTVIFSYRGRWA